MATEKQKQRDFEYLGDYKSAGRYTKEQWIKMISDPEIINGTDYTILKQIYSSCDHTVTMLQMQYEHEKDMNYYLDRMNRLGERLAVPNHISSDIDLQGKEYWWFLFFWGRHTKERDLEWKLQPELADAIEELESDLAEEYEQKMAVLDESLAYRYSKEEAVWIAAALLLYERFYTMQDPTADDLLLMQYEVQTRAQAIYGQDVPVETITVTCNSDDPKHAFSYLRDDYKYWRVCYPGEFKGESLWPDDLDFNKYVYTIFGYKQLNEIMYFISHDYASVVNENYVALDVDNPYFKLSQFLQEYGGTKLIDDEAHMERNNKIKASAQEAVDAFHALGDILLDQYPDYMLLEKFGYMEGDYETIRSYFLDSFLLPEYSSTNATLNIMVLQSNENSDDRNIQIALAFPYSTATHSEAILEACKPLTVLTSANFICEDTADLSEIYRSLFGSAILAYASFSPEQITQMPYADFMSKAETAIQMLAYYYKQICENAYISYEEPEAEDVDSSYDEGTDFYDETKTDDDFETENSYNETAETTAVKAPNTAASSAMQAGAPYVPPITGTSSAPICAEPVFRYMTARETHIDRTTTDCTLYPLNQLISGSSQCGKTKEAMYRAVSIIENTNLPTLVEENSTKELTSRYETYLSEGRILYMNLHKDLSYKTWIDGPIGEGIFTSFCNRIKEGRYVLFMDNVQNVSLKKLWKETAILLETNKREGKEEAQQLILPVSRTAFSIPSNLYIIGTWDTSKQKKPMDSFLLRTFSVIEKQKDPSVLEKKQILHIDLKKLLTVINLRLAYLLDESHQLGNGLFTALDESAVLEDLGDLFVQKIIPLLSSWFDGSKENVALVLGDSKKESLPKLLQHKIIDPSALFGANFASEKKDILYFDESTFYLEETYLAMYCEESEIEDLLATELPEPEITPDLYEIEETESDPEKETDFVADEDETEISSDDIEASLASDVETDMTNDFPMEDAVDHDSVLEDETDFVSDEDVDSDMQSETEISSDIEASLASDVETDMTNDFPMEDTADHDSDFENETDFVSDEDSALENETPAPVRNVLNGVTSALPLISTVPESPEVLEDDDIYF